MSIEIDWSKTSMRAIGAMVANFNHPDGHGHVVFIYSPADRNKYREGPASWEYHHAPVEVPAAPWTGEGLPPIGTEFEFTTNDGYNWHKGSLLFRDSQVVLLNSYQLFKIEDPDLSFRSIRTAEQIAAEERAKEVDYMVGFIRERRMSVLTPENPKQEAVLAAEALYDAGFRRVTE